MASITDKLILLICSAMLYTITVRSEYVIVPLLLVVLTSSLSIYFQHQFVHVLLFLLYIIACGFFPQLFLFIPVIIYELAFTSFQYCIFFIFFPLALHNDFFKAYTISFLFIFCILSFYLKNKTDTYHKLKESYHLAVNNSTELALLQEEKNRNLLENQDYEINIATLNERNRISKEIHDHIGHVLSRALIQIGALLTISKEPVIREALSQLKDSISEGMDSIRASVHNMYDESIDLYQTLDDVIKGFTFCPITFEYDTINAPKLKLKYCFIAIVKESLSNIMKHSDATKVSVIIKEEPYSYSLYIMDNGTISEKTKAIARRVQLSSDYVEGMGLKNMIDRVKGFQGKFEILAQDGFKILITISKDKIN